MELSDDKERKYIKKLLLSRMRILCNNGFYGLLLMHMIYSIDENCNTVATDGKRIFFNPNFLNELDDKELDFVMMHEILHIVLQHCFRKKEREDKRFNNACDIVVNSNILLSNNMNLDAISLKKYGVCMHLAPNEEEGYEYSAEEVYEMLQEHNNPPSNKTSKGETSNDKYKGGSSSSLEETNQINAKSKNHNSAWDDHDRWGNEDNEYLSELWEKRFEDACEVISRRNSSNGIGDMPLLAERYLRKLKNPQVDWRLILNDFIQEEVTDYSFMPPDRRFNDNPFFLPDFNEKDDSIENILFMIDTSGSMSDEMVTAAYSEVKGAIDQFAGKLKGWLGFFDSAIIEPKPFENEEDFKIIKPFGGGGTDFKIIFDYVKKHMNEKMPACIIILTDGFASFPSEKYSNGIPVLWLINNEEVIPPWGKVARITVKT